VFTDGNGWMLTVVFVGSQRLGPSAGDRVSDPRRRQRSSAVSHLYGRGNIISIRAEKRDRQIDDVFR